MSDRVVAAGGLVWRPSDSSEGFDVLLVHRPKYDDWSLPKGKADPGEEEIACALREVEEETGVRCDIGESLGTYEYIDRKGRPKIVHWFLMTPAASAGAAGVPPSVAAVPEIDDVKWIPANEALLLLTYEHDRVLVAGFTPPSAD